MSQDPEQTIPCEADIAINSERMMALTELLAQAVPGAFPSKDQIILLNQVRAGTVSTLIDAAWEGVARICANKPNLLQQKMSAGSDNRSFDADDHAGQCMVLSERMGLGALARAKNDASLSVEQMKTLPSETIALLAFVARKAIFLKLQEMQIDVRALP